MKVCLVKCYGIQLLQSYDDYWGSSYETRYLPAQFGSWEEVTNEEAEKLRNYINRQNRTQGEYKYCLFVQDDSMVPTSLADYQNLIDKDKKQADILEKRRIKEKKEQEAEKLARKKKRLAKLKKELGE